MTWRCDEMHVKLVVLLDPSCRTSEGVNQRIVLQELQKEKTW